MSAPISNVRPAPDKVLTDIADYVTKFDVSSSEAYDTARYCLMDTLGCGFEALEYTDPWPAAEWGHPPDTPGGILMAADWPSRHTKPLAMRDVLTAMIKAHEIQGVLALENSFNRVGLDHVVLVKVASTAVIAHM